MPEKHLLAYACAPHCISIPIDDFRVAVQRVYIAVETLVEWSIGSCSQNRRGGYVESPDMQLSPYSCAPHRISIPIDDFHIAGRRVYIAVYLTVERLDEGSIRWWVRRVARYAAAPILLRAASHIDPH